MNIRAMIGVLSAELLLSGCLVGPNYKGPPDAAQRTLEQGHFARAIPDSQTSAPPPSRWWEQVDDPLLTRMIDESLAASPRLQVAQARIRSARAQLQQNRAMLLPTGGANASYTRARISTGGITSSGGAAAGTTAAIPNPLKFGLYNAGFDASWELDVFGGTRRSIESAQAATEARQAAFEDAQVELASDVGKAYVQLREAQGRRRLLERSLALRQEALDLMQQRRLSGTGTEIELQQSREQIAQSRAQLPALQFTIDQQLDQLAILGGREPGALDAVLQLPEGTVTQPMPPETVAMEDPKSWLVNRPDIREAERTLAARSATIGQNVASYFPQVTLLGLIGFSGAAPSALFHGSPTSIGLPSLSWNVLNIPRTRAKVRGAEADRDEAAADYQRVVLEALQDANDSLSRFGQQREVVTERLAALESARQSAILASARRTAGTATRLDELDAQRADLTDEDQLDQDNSQLMQSFIALQKSLGLGWKDSPAPPALVGRNLRP